MLEKAIKQHGKTASIMRNSGSQIYANWVESKRQGESEFAKKHVNLDIRYILARVKRPQTNGKLERIHGNIQRTPSKSEAILMSAGDPIDLHEMVQL